MALISSIIFFRFADGFKIADILKKDFSDSFRYFSTRNIPWNCTDVDHMLQIEAPIIQLNRKGDYHSFRFNNDDRACLKGISSEESQEFYKHLRVLQDLLRDPKNVFEILLNPGTMIICDNQRVLHGRTAFEGRDRNMLGCYMDRDIVESRMKMLGIEMV
jgi:alpha-ketoglutarate-dependent taurine dioxygenase